MRFRDQVALTLPSLILRVMLAVIFLWAGGFKVFTKAHFTPEQAATLASLGVNVTPAGAPAPDTASPPSQPLPDPTPEDAPAGDEPESADDASATGDTPLAPLREPASHTHADPALDEAPGILLASWQPDAETDPDTDDAIESLNDAPAQPAPPPPAPAPAPALTAADFPHGADATALYGLALAIDHAANPPLDDQSNLPPPYWPQNFGTGHWPRTLAWCVALGELACGLALLLGLFTRLAALGVASIMLGAMWLTQIGPAIQSGDTFLGFLPNHPINDPGAWTTLLFQFALFSAALAVFLLGSGAIGLDRAIFRRSRALRYDTEPSYKPAEEYASKRPSV